MADHHDIPDDAATGDDGTVRDGAIAACVAAALPSGDHGSLECLYVTLDVDDDAEALAFLRGYRHCGNRASILWRASVDGARVLIELGHGCGHEAVLRLELDAVAHAEGIERLADTGTLVLATGPWGSVLADIVVAFGVEGPAVADAADHARRALRRARAIYN